jgi:chemotaxis protein methyltransferase CheR
VSAFAAILDHVHERTGLVFPASRIEDANRAVTIAMKAAASTDPAVYFDSIRENAAAFDDLVAELTVGETYFYRDSGQFETLRNEILPDIARRRPGTTIRAWSAGCATGEEPYSLAILFQEEGLRASLLATDISMRALARAQEATYGAWSLRGADAAYRDRYFDRVRDRFVLRADVRREVRFQIHNLAAADYPGDFDLIL